MKKHSHQEILLKLDRAAELMRAGKTQVDVCKALGVSVMTFHRWRKLSGVAQGKERTPEPPTLRGSSNTAELGRLLDELTNENRRLRKIVTDLLLEKTKLEESVAAMPAIVASKKTISNGA